MTNEALYWPSGRVAQRTNCVAFDLLGELPNHVDFVYASFALHKTIHHLVQPDCSLATRCALLFNTILNQHEETRYEVEMDTFQSYLSAALMFVEETEASNGVDQVSLLVHDDDGSCAETGLCLDQ